MIFVILTLANLDKGYDRMLKYTKFNIAVNGKSNVLYLAENPGRWL